MPRARDLAQFRRWYCQAGTPVVARPRRTSTPRRGPGTRCTSRSKRRPPRGQLAKLPFHIPLAVGLLGPAGQDLPLALAGETRRTARRPACCPSPQAAASFPSPALRQAPVPSLNRRFSAPIELEYAYCEADLEFLATHDSDPVNRWDAAQRCFCAPSSALAQAHAAQHPLAAATGTGFAGRRCWSPTSTPIPRCVRWR